MPQYILEIPKEGVLREVLEADLPHYLGNDAKVLDSRKADKYIIETVQKPSRSIIASLRDDTSRWRRSEDYNRRLPYSGSRIHQERKRACRGRDDAHHATTVAPLIVPTTTRPPLSQRYSSSSSSPVSNYDSVSRVQSRRESDAMSPIDGGAISRTISVSSVSSEYGNNGSYGWNNDPSYGTNGGYGFASSHRRPSAYSRP